MHIAIAPFTLKQGVTEDQLIDMSDEFDRLFVKAQEGIQRRILVRSPEGGYADLVFFSDQVAMEQVLAAEQESEACAAFFSIMDDDGAPLMFEVVKTYE